MKRHSDLAMTQKSARFLAHRIRDSFDDALEDVEVFVGPVEIDETYMEGKERNKHNKDKAKKGTVIVDNTKMTVQGFMTEHTTPETVKYTDCNRS